MPTFGPQALPYPNPSDAADVPGVLLTLLQKMQVGGAIPYTSKSALDASGTGFAGQLAVVTADSTAWKNGVWESNGTAWSLIAAPRVSGTVTGNSGTPSYSAGGVTLYTENGRAYMNGLFTSTSASFTTATSYAIGNLPSGFFPPATKIFASSANGFFSQVTIDTSGHIGITVGGSFTAALSVSMDPCSWDMS